MAVREPITITEESSAQRLDNFLYNLFNKQVARAHIYSLIRTGQVRINKGRIKPNYYLKVNDLVRIPPINFGIKSNASDNSSPLTSDVNQKTKITNQFKKNLTFWQKKIENSIIFENANLLIINKPVNLAVHGGSKINIGLIEIVRSVKPDEHFLELVHRLDRDTSGCIMIAKKRSYLKKLHELLKTKKIKKNYSALVKGLFNKKKIVELPLKKIIKNSKEHYVKVCQTGDPATTVFKPENNYLLSTFANCNLQDSDPKQQSLTQNNEQIKFSLITASPITGRTHQIRVHLSNIGYPIANDDKYGDRKYNIYLKKLGLNRMFLHAKNLNFICPVTGDTINVNAEYDTELINFLLKLEKLCERT